MFMIYAENQNYTNGPPCWGAVAAGLFLFIFVSFVVIENLEHNSFNWKSKMIFWPGEGREGSQSFIRIEIFRRERCRKSEKTEKIRGLPGDPLGPSTTV